MPTNSRLRIIGWLLVCLACGIAYLMIGVVCFAQEIKGPTTVTQGTLAVFGIDPPQAASWVVTPLGAENGFLIDSSSSKMYFASPVAGTFTIVAAICVEEKTNDKAVIKKPLQLVATFVNGDKKDGEDEAEPDNNKHDNTSSIGTWIDENVKSFYTGTHPEELSGILTVFAAVADKIDRGSIKTATAARSRLTIDLTASLAGASPDAVNDWLPFITALSEKVKIDLGEKIDDLDSVKQLLRDIAGCKPTFSQSFSQSSSQKDSTAEPTQTTTGQCPTGQCPTIYYR